MFYLYLQRLSPDHFLLKWIALYITGQLLYLALTLPKFIILADNYIAKENFNLRIQA